MNGNLMIFLLQHTVKDLNIISHSFEFIDTFLNDALSFDNFMILCFGLTSTGVKKPKQKGLKFLV